MSRPVSHGAVVAGALFALFFFVGLVLIGDQAGAFADSEAAFNELFADEAQRTQHVAGSLLLIVAAIAFAIYAYGVGDDPRLGPTPMLAVVVRASGVLAAGAMLGAGAAFLTVPLSLVMGDFFDDPGIVSGQAILPHLGYVLLVAGVGLAAAVVILAQAQVAGQPRWFVWFSRVSALLLVIGAPSVAGMGILPIWTVVAVVARRGGTPASRE